MGLLAEQTEVTVYWNDAQWWAWIPMSLVMLGFWGLVAWAIVRLAASQKSDEPAAPSALELLDARLARGEIDPGEYRERRAVLEGRDGR
jgi:putative membrane protein